MTERLFAGLKVIDCASWIAGPAAATILSDFGADVIKIEPPGAGDPWRASTPVPGKTTDYYWQLTSRNKRSLALDLKQEDGLGVLYRLLTTADVFVTNFPLPVRERLKIAAAQVLPLNPRLIYASLSAYGEEGDEAGRTGFDSTVYWARTGLMDMVRASADTEPARSVPGMGDHPSATALYAAIVTALYRREKTGRGGIAQSSLLQNGLWANACFIQSRLCGEEVPIRAPRAQASNPLANHYRCRDGRWFIMALFNEQRQLPGFLAAIGARHLADDQRFATSAARRQNAGALVAILDEVFAERDLAEWRSILAAAGVTFGAVNSVDECSNDLQFQRIGALVAFADGNGLTVSSPFHLDGETKVAPNRAPAIGQHSQEILQEAGYAMAEIDQLRAQGVLG
ncbi:MAG TPA: CoA transferase [Hyphomicrobiaceae bacterium]|jgi:formyl-CoA transferase|nr:CoA transferase [Hyphomicrobiaceae bacterium]